MNTQATETVSFAETHARSALTRRMHKLLLVQSGREDLLLHVEWDPAKLAAAPAPAFFDLLTNTVTLQGPLGLNGLETAQADPRTPAGRAKMAAMIGMCAHEASHAHSSPGPAQHRALMAALSPAEFTACGLLEEARIEGRQLARRPQDRQYLRASARLVIGELSEWITASTGATRAAAAHTTALMLGRARAGVFTADEVAAAHAVLDESLDGDLPALVEIIEAFVALADEDLDQMQELARQWVALVGENPAEDAPTGCSVSQESEDQDGQSQSGASGDGQGQDGEGQGQDGEDSGGTPETPAQAARRVFGQQLAEALQETAEATEAADEAPQTPARVVPTKHVEAAQVRAEDNAAHEAAKKVAAAVFDDTVSHGYSAHRTANPFGPERQPSTAERRAARTIGVALKSAQFRDRTLTAYESTTPPGRLNGRDAMFGAAQRTLGMPVTATPFRAEHSRRAPEPPMTLGFSFDISGSMSWAEEVLASMAWSFAHATTYVKGRSASVLFGGSVHALVHPGRVPARVRTFECPDGSEDFTGAFAALDGALNLVRGTGVRLLTVISDGHYKGTQTRGCQEAVGRFVRSGGHVLWIGQPGTVFPEGVIPLEIDTREVDQVPAAVAATLTTVLRRAR